MHNTKKDPYQLLQLLAAAVYLGPQQQLTITKEFLSNHHFDIEISERTFGGEAVITLKAAEPRPKQPRSGNTAGGADDFLP
jgi:hypothetical protein